MGDKGKFLVDFVERLGTQRGFFAMWTVIVVGFVILYLNHRRRLEQRNFRDKPYQPNWGKTDSKRPGSHLVSTKDEKTHDVTKIFPK